MSQTSTTTPRAIYMVSARYDWAFFLAPPIVALAVGFLISGTPFADNELEGFLDYRDSAAALMIGIIIHAHLVAVFFRSHGNAQIFAAHRFRFLAVPVLLYAAMMASSWILVGISVLVTFWDVYHSALQTFGFGRIYDGRCGNDATVGRGLDWWLNQLLYVGPIVAGATMMDHFQDFEEFESLGTALFTRVPAYMASHQRYFTQAILGTGALFLVYYVFAYWRLQRQGHRVSWLKVWLYVSTGLTSIYTWGFNSFGEAFFIMNLFHAVQYFGIVWATEQNNLMRLFRVEKLSAGKPLALLFFLCSAGAYGAWAELSDPDLEMLWAITLVVSVLHFWYDGFIWSVRKHQV